MHQFFQPPLYWQQFEELVGHMLAEVYDIPSVQPYGRAGQAQHGVDVYGLSSRHGWIAVQCKRLDDTDANGRQLPGGKITKKFLSAEGRASLSFPQPISLWIMATTVRRDTRQQQHADELTMEWRASGLDRTAVVWAWDDLVSNLNTFPALRQRYYSDVIQVSSPADLDRMILETISMAFQRPAFEVPLRIEMTDEFLQALKDTQRVLQTGELVDRESRHIIRKAVGGHHQIHTPNWKMGLGVIVDRLSKLRAQLQDGLKDGTIEQVNGYLVFRNPKTVAELEALRGGCVSALNQVLSDAKLPRI